jgi:anti-sigma B factor antagonist
MENGRYRLVLDLEGATFLSSAGLRILLNTQKNCKRYNRGELILAAVPANILAALELSGFVPIFRIFDDVLTAVGNI